MSRRALQEITQILTKGPAQFDGWSVVAERAKQVADKALAAPDEVKRLLAIIEEIRESKALDYDSVQEELKPLFDRALNPLIPPPVTPPRAPKPLKQDNCACDEKSPSVGCANRGFWHAGDPISRLKDIKEGRKIGIRKSFK